MTLPGWASYLVGLVTQIGIYAVLALGLNIQWGFTGLFNIGIGAFFAIGAYATAIVTTPASPDYVGGFELPFGVGLLMAMALSGTLAAIVGLITLKLRSDYLAIATIGIAEIVRLVLKNEAWLTNGVRGIAAIPKPFLGWLPSPDPVLYSLVFLVLVLIIVGILYVANERAYRSPWGRVLRAIREDELATQAAGKGVLKFRLQAFILGSMIMGLGGSLYAHSIGFISPEAFQPEFATFIVWVMLIAGGSGNNRGALLGAFCIWSLWSGTQFFTQLLPSGWETRAGALRVLLIGVLLQIILLARPKGFLPERPPLLKAPRSSRSEGS